MKYSDNAMSAILLCSYIRIKKEAELKPLTLGEWSQFLNQLIEMKYEPSIVLEDKDDKLRTMKYPVSFIDRINRLVARGGAVAMELEELSQKGIKVITLFDSDYPILIKKKLKRKTPPILYYAGEIDLAKKIGIAVVGSRNVDEEGMTFTRKLVEKASQEKLIVYSGGAKGVDSISETTALENGSAVVSFITDSLLKKIKNKEVLNNIIHGRLLLISDVKPDVGFQHREQ